MCGEEGNVPHWADQVPTFIRCYLNQPLVVVVI